METNHNQAHESAETAYQANGYQDRAEYLDALAEGSSNPEAVYALADILGSDEDFDGLISSIEDFDLMDDML